MVKAKDEDDEKDSIAALEKIVDNDRLDEKEIEIDLNKRLNEKI